MTDKEAKAFYNSSAWKHKRMQILDRDHYECQDCRKRIKDAAASGTQLIGTMLADRIKGGTLELGGAGNGNGVAKVLNADGNEIVRLDKDGVYAKGKYVCANTDGSQTATLSNGKLTFKTESYEVVIRAGAIGGLTGLMIYPEQGAVRTKFLSIGDKLSARFDNISLLASGKTTIGGASLEVQRDGKGYSGKTGKAVFSDGTYLEYVNGFLVGGNTKEGGF